MNCGHSSGACVCEHFTKSAVTKGQAPFSWEGVILFGLDGWNGQFSDIGILMYIINAISSRVERAFKNSGMLTMLRMQKRKKRTDLLKEMARNILGSSPMWTVRKLRALHKRKAEGSIRRSTFNSVMYGNNKLDHSAGLGVDKEIKHRKAREETTGRRSSVHTIARLRASWPCSPRVTVAAIQS